jgi:protein gp37
MSPTKIEWTEETWNPVTGCTPSSAGCKNCYARRMARRLAGRYGYPEGDGFAVTLHPSRLDQPLRWRKPRRVFVCSMGDLFHEDVPWGFIAMVWLRMAQAPRHTYQILTKRPRGMLEWMRSEAHEAGPMKHVWLGVTAENQEALDERKQWLVRTPAAVRFLSVEPMIGPVSDDLTSIDWVICGGETGPGARPMNPEWAISLQEQCRNAGVPFFFKKWSAAADPAIPMPREYPGVAP